MNIFSYHLTHATHDSSGSGRNVQATTEEEKPASKKARIGPYSVFENSNLIPRLDMLFAENEYKNKVHKCKKCEFNTKNHDYFKQHQIIHRTSEQQKKRFKCEKCIYNTNHHGNFKQHQEMHSRVKAKANKNEDIQLTVVPVPKTTLETRKIVQATYIWGKSHSTPESSSKDSELEGTTPKTYQWVKSKAKIASSST